MRSQEEEVMNRRPHSKGLQCAKLSAPSGRLPSLRSLTLFKDSNPYTSPPGGEPASSRAFHFQIPLSLPPFPSSFPPPRVFPSSFPPPRVFPSSSPPASYFHHDFPSSLPPVSCSRMIMICSLLTFPDIKQSPLPQLLQDLGDPGTILSS